MHLWSRCDRRRTPPTALAGLERLRQDPRAWVRRASEKALARQDPGRPVSPRLLVEEVFHLSPPRGLVVMGPVEGVLTAGSWVDLVRSGTGQRWPCRVDGVLMVSGAEGRRSLTLSGLPDGVSPVAGDVLEGGTGCAS